MIDHPSLDDLAAFACVARERSFRRAAAELGTSTSNLSHTIRRLETKIRCRLLQRNSRSVSVTEAGDRLLATLQPALDGITGALDTLDQIRDDVSGTLRLTATREAYNEIIWPVLATFTAMHPSATVEVVIEYGFRDIVAERFDAGIRLGEKLEQDMIALKVGDEITMTVVASPDYIARYGVPARPQDLVQHRCINYRMPAAGTIYAWEFGGDGSEFEVRVPGPLTFNEPTPMLECALAGLGIAYLPKPMVKDDVGAGRLVEMLADWLSPFPGYHLYYSTRQQMRPVLTAFILALRKERFGLGEASANSKALNSASV